MRKIVKVILLICLLIGMGRLSAQNPNNALLYSHQAVLLGDQGSANDPVSIVMPGTAYASGLGSFLDNPASLALQKKGFGEFGMSFRSVNEDATYLGQSRSVNTRSLDNSQNNVSNLGFVYSFPTVQGSFVIGAGYTQHSIYNRSLRFRGRNEHSSITDQFKVDGSPFQEIAFNTFATDYGDEFEDWDESIFRVGFDRFGDFLGIHQQGDIVQKGYSGEYSLFFGTEIQRNLMFGASLGVLSGNFNYDRIFQENDDLYNYRAEFIDSNDDGIGDTDIDRITLDDQLNSNFNGFKARVGLLYQFNVNVSAGVSYTFPTSLEVEEVFQAEIRTRFNNEVEFTDETDSEFTYKINYPSKVGLGLAFTYASGWDLSLAAEYTDYSATAINFGESDLFDSELIENDFINDSYRSVWNFRLGTAYTLPNDITIRAGYSYLPSRFVNGDDNRNVYAAGAGFNLTEGIRFEVAGQLARWNEVSAVYDYGEYDYSLLPDSPPTVTFRSEEADRSVERLNVLGTIRFRL